MAKDVKLRQWCLQFAEHVGENPRTDLQILEMARLSYLFVSGKDGCERWLDLDQFSTLDENARNRLIQKREERERREIESLKYALSWVEARLR